jgi:hypothetical protein
LNIRSNVRQAVGLPTFTALGLSRKHRWTGGMEEDEEEEEEEEEAPDLEAPRRQHGAPNISEPGMAV